MKIDGSQGDAQQSVFPVDHGRGSEERTRMTGSVDISQPVISIPPPPSAVTIDATTRDGGCT